MEVGKRYAEWKEEFEQFLKGLSDKQIVLLYSGGKDSTLALDYMLRASEEYGFRFEAHGGTFPVHRYNEAELDKLNSYWASRGVDINWHQPGDSDDILEAAPNPCKACQSTNKGFLNILLKRLVGDNWTDLVVVAGYSLWDIVSYTVEHILNNVYTTGGNDMEPEQEKRLIETAQRFYPVLRMEEGFTVFRPLVRINTTDIYEEIRSAGIPILSTTCNYLDYRPKRHLMRYYEKMDMAFDYDQVLSFAKSLPHFPDISPYSFMEREEYFSKVF